MTNNRNQGPAEIWVCPSGTSINPVSNVNPFPVAIVSGGGSGGTASSFGAAFPGVGTAAGFIDPSGNMAGAKVDSSGNLLVSGSFSASTAANASASAPTYTPGTQPLSQDLSGNLRTIFANTAIALNAGSAIIGKVGIDQTTPGTTNAVDVTNFPLTVDVNNGAASNSTIRQCIASTNSAVALWGHGATAAAVPANATYVGMNVGGNLVGLLGTANGLQVVSPTAANFLVTATLGAGSAVIGHVITDTGSTTAVTQATAANLNATVVGTGTFAVQAAQSGTWTVGISASQTIAVTQATAASLNATVVGTGTFAVQAAQTGTWTVGLSAGSNLVGKVGIDQTTPGTTNAVSLAQIGSTTVASGNGVSGAGSQRINVASDNSSIANWGQGATGSAVPGAAIYHGLLAKTGNPTAASDGNLVGAMADKLGRQVVSIGNVRDNKGNQRTALSSASETTVVTQVTSTFLDVYGVIAANTTGSAVNLIFKDSTAGTTQFDLTVPANETRGFMLPSSDGFKQTTVNNNWTVTGGASGVNIDVLYVKNI